MHLKKKIGIFIIVIIVLLQFFPVQKPEVVFENPNDFIVNVSVPENISTKLKAACYDCHSNESKFPWYAQVAPSKWMVFKHINEGRNELNFSNWNILNKDDKVEILDDISTVLMDDEMPLKNYILLHPEAKLTEDEKEIIINWTDELLETLYEK